MNPALVALFGLDGGPSMQPELLLALAGDTVTIARSGTNLHGGTVRLVHDRVVVPGGQLAAGPVVPHVAPVGDQSASLGEGSVADCSNSRRGLGPLVGLPIEVDALAFLVCGTGAQGVGQAAGLLAVASLELVRGTGRPDQI